MEPLIILTKAELSNLLDDFERRLTAILKEVKKEEVPSNEWATASEVSQFLKISLTTLHSWSNKGILIKHKIGRQIRFKRDEIQSALTRLESKNGRAWKK